MACGLDPGSADALDAMVAQSATSTRPMAQPALSAALFHSVPLLDRRLRIVIVVPSLPTFVCEGDPSPLLEQGAFAVGLPWSQVLAQCCVERNGHVSLLLCCVGAVRRADRTSQAARRRDRRLPAASLSAASTRWIEPELQHPWAARDGPGRRTRSNPRAAAAGAARVAGTQSEQAHHERTDPRRVVAGRAAGVRAVGSADEHLTPSSLPGGPAGGA